MKGEMDINNELSFQQVSENIKLQKKQQVVQEGTSLSHPKNDTKLRAAEPPQQGWHSGWISCSLGAVMELQGTSFQWPGAGP